MSKINILSIRTTFFFMVCVLNFLHIPCYSTSPTNQNSAVFLIDVWEDHWDKSWFAIIEEHIKSHINPFREFCEEQNIPVFLFLHDIEVNSLILPLKSNEVIITGIYKNYLKNFLKHKGIENIFYGGYATNICVLARPCGMIKLKSDGFKVDIIRDITLGFDYNHSHKHTSKVIFKKTEETISEIESKYGRSLSSREFMQFFLHNNLNEGDSL